MDLSEFWTSLEYSSLGDFVAVSIWAFPTIETLHVIAVALVVGSIAIVDLRLLGLASRDTAVTRLSREMLRLTWGAFALAVVTGLLMFVSKASSYAVNPYFLSKMGLIAAAGLNMLYFHFVTWKDVDQWDAAETIPVQAKLAGALSLLFWVVVVFLGRVIGFTLELYF